MCSTKTATGCLRRRRRSRVRRPCTGRRRSSSQVQVITYLFKITSSVPTYLLISHTGYDPATAFGHTGMFRGAPPVGGPYPGMVPGPQIPAYTGSFMFRISVSTCHDERHERTLTSTFFA